MSAFALPCGCVVQILTDNVQRVFKLCDCCAKDFNDPIPVSRDACRSECDCDHAESISHDPNCNSRTVCDEGRYCDRHFAEAELENRWMLRSSFGAVTGRMSEQDKQDMRDAGRGHLVRS